MTDSLPVGSWPAIQEILVITVDSSLVNSTAVLRDAVEASPDQLIVRLRARARARVCVCFFLGRRDLSRGAD